MFINSLAGQQRMILPALSLLLLLSAAAVSLARGEAKFFDWNGMMFPVP